jgi:esterase/lipase superfamily enzyme
MHTYAMKEAADKHVMLLEITELKSRAFNQRLSNELAQRGHTAFLYIHGYYNSFPDAARKAAQISVDLKIDTVPILFSWPSQNRIGGYFEDYEAERESVQDLAQFIQEILGNGGITKLHIIAHSMGNDVTLSALQGLSKTVTMPFAELVLAAPDVDEGVFTALIPKVKPLFSRITTYVSSKDLALQASHWFRKSSNRAGDSNPRPIILQEMATIDTTHASEDWLGHTFATSGSVLVDLYEVLSGKREAERFWLKPRQDLDGKHYWAFSAH